MAKLGELAVYLKAHTDEFQSGLLRANKMTRQFTKAAVATGAAAGAALLKMSYDAVQASSVQEIAERKVAGVLKATGYAAQMTTKQMADYASELSRTTGIADEELLSNMGILTSFKNVSGEVFRETTAVAADMSAVMGQDMKASMVQLGKAINDPTARLASLQEVGVTFTEQQKEQIKQLQASGDLMGAQKLVLAELRSEFGGAAAEMADATPWVNTANAMGDMNEVLGRIVSDIINLDDNSRTLTEHIREATSWLKQNASGIAVFVKIMFNEIEYGWKRIATVGENVIANWIITWENNFKFVGNLMQYMIDSYKAAFNAIVDMAKETGRAIWSFLKGEGFNFNLENIRLQQVEFGKYKMTDRIAWDQGLKDLDKQQAREQAKILADAIDRTSKEGLREIAENRAAKNARDAASGKGPGTTVQQAISKAQFAGALQRGSVEAYRAEIRRAPKVQEKILTEAKEQTTQLKQIVENTRAGSGITFNEVEIPA